MLHSLCMVAGVCWEPCCLKESASSNQVGVERFEACSSGGELGRNGGVALRTQCSHWEVACAVRIENGTFV